MTSPSDEVKEWQLIAARTREMLGLTDLPFEPENVSVTQAYNKLPQVRITFVRDLTSYEAEQYRRIIQREPWPSKPAD